ncbi:GntR family transcriptional regulator [Bosea sp. LjRoot9]|jgi:DNA-binding GntR family transcriptional regulator|uniref:GntR family transcriptional regulator n=1 Tax=Bosea sp. LjRoot9 TaxID=3342341 RepID=UPI003ECE242D
MTMEYRTKEEQVADFLREGILSGQFPRGTRLKQVEIAELLKTSITPVREALKLLEAEGYITGSSYKGATVVPFDVTASSEILMLRMLLEAQLVRGAVEKLQTSDVEKLRTLAAEFEAAAKKGDSSAARAINYRFHRRIYDIADLPHTLHFVQILWARYPFDLINRLSGRAERAAAEHAELLDQMIAGDTAGAMLTTRRHIETGWAELRTSLNE